MTGRTWPGSAAASWSRKKRPPSERMLGAVELAIGAVAEAAAKRIADQQRSGQNGRGDRGPEGDRQVRPAVVRQGVRE